MKFCYRDVLQHIADNKLEPKPFQALARQVTTDAVKKDVAVADVVTKSISSPTAPPLVLDDIEYIDSEISSMRKAIAQRVSQSKVLYTQLNCSVTFQEVLSNVDPCLMP